MSRMLGRANLRKLSLAGLLALSVSLALAGTALAKEPTGDFAVYKQCPRFTTGVELCVYSKVFGGEVAINSQKTPINADKKHEITLQGGIKFGPSGEESFVGALNGETLSKTPQNVPGGLTGLINCSEIKGEGLLEVLAALARAACKKLLEENPLSGVNAVTELAKPASEITINRSNELNQEGTALGLPVKVKLENTFLGSECYVGSNSNPIELNLTTGTTNPKAPNKPITGVVGEIEFKDEFEIVETKGTKLVNNEFSAPEASGCGGIFAAVVDPIVNKKLGLPSPDGHNTAIQEANVGMATTTGVINSEK